MTCSKNPTLPITLTDISGLGISDLRVDLTPPSGAPVASLFNGGGTGAALLPHRRSRSGLEQSAERTGTLPPYFQRPSAGLAGLPTCNPNSRTVASSEAGAWWGAPATAGKSPHICGPTLLFRNDGSDLFADLGTVSYLSISDRVSIRAEVDALVSDDQTA